MDKEALLSGPQIDTEVVDLGGGRKVTVQGLTRAEAIQVGDAKTTLDRDRKLVAWGCVDPELTYQDVERWQQARGAAGEIEKVSMAIARLSGMLPGSEKEAVQRFPGEPES